jgi:hypothetical protein
MVEISFCVYLSRRHQGEKDSIIPIRDDQSKVRKSPALPDRQQSGALFSDNPTDPKRVMAICVSARVSAADCAPGKAQYHHG